MVDTVRLVGPVGINTVLVVEGVLYTVSNGTVTPDLPRDLVPDVLYGYGFYEAQDKEATQSPPLVEAPEEE